MQIGFLGLLQVVLIGLYLGGPIAHWSLWWVFAPLLVGPFLVLIGLALAGIGALAIYLSERRRLRKRLSR
jgi:hypothetical protein